MCVNNHELQRTGNAGDRARRRGRLGAAVQNTTHDRVSKCGQAHKKEAGARSRRHNQRDMTPHERADGEGSGCMINGEHAPFDVVGQVRAVI